MRAQFDGSGTCTGMNGMFPALSTQLEPSHLASLTMSMSVHHERDNVYRLDLHGLLQKGDLDRCQEVLIKEMRRVGNVRLIFVLSGFEGWDAHDDWRDMGFYAKYGSSIDRIAIVGDERWRDETLIFAGADLRRAPTEFFPSASLAQARQWLTS
jgi:hypothetical protein